MSPSAHRVCSEPGGQKPVLSLSLDLIHWRIYVALGEMSKHGGHVMSLGRCINFLFLNLRVQYGFHSLCLSLMRKIWTKSESLCVLFQKIKIISNSEPDELRWRKVDSLAPNDVIWWKISGSTLAQVMACCLTARSHYLNQYWLINTKVL